MVYRRSHDIEKRLEEVLRLIREGSYATPALAKVLHVSIPTISRCVTALRERGHAIRAEKLAAGWRYFIPNTDSRNESQHDQPHRQTRQTRGQNQPRLANHEAIRVSLFSGTRAAPQKGISFR